MKDAYWSPEDDAREAALDAEQLAREQDGDQVDIDEAQRFDREEEAEQRSAEQRMERLRDFACRLADEAIRAATGGAG